MDYSTWTCEALAAFIADPATSPLDRTAAQSAYDAKNCAGTSGGTGTGSESGGGGGRGLPHGG